MCKCHSACTIKLFAVTMEQRILKKVNNYLNTNIYFNLETYGGPSMIYD